MRIIKKTIFEIDINDESSGRILKTEIYNSNNQLIEGLVYYRSGEIEHHHIFEYDRHGNLINEKTLTSDGSTTEVKYKYDEDNSLTETNMYNASELMQKEYIVKGNDKITYITENNEGEEIEKNIEHYLNSLMMSREHYMWGEKSEHQQYKYNIKEEIISKSVIMYPEKNLIEVLFILDEDGTTIEETRKDEDDIIFHSKVNKINSNKIIEEIEELGFKITIETNLNDKGEIESEVLLGEEGNLLTKTLYERDEFNQIIEIRYFNTSGNLNYGESYITRVEIEYEN